MRIAWALGFLLSICACSNGGGASDAGADSGDAGQPPSPCSSDSDCANIGDHCYFVIDGGCTVQSVTGVCLGFSPPSNCTANVNVACGCDGTTISVCAPAGYVNRSSMHAGPCPTSDAGTDSGSSDAAAE